MHTNKTKDTKNENTGASRNEKIWQAVNLIPKGKVATYGQIAKLVGLPGYARHVGHAMKQLPKGSKIPWYRVINSQGKISLPEGSASYKLQKKLLTEEGITFLKGKISLKIYQWNP